MKEMSIRRRLTLGSGSIPALAPLLTPGAVHRMTALGSVIRDIHEPPFQATEDSLESAPDGRMVVEGYEYEEASATVSGLLERLEGGIPS